MYIRFDWINPVTSNSNASLYSYAELKSSKCELLEGYQLDAALDNRSVESQSAQSSEEQMREEIAHLEQELVAMRRRKELLAWQRDKLAMHQTVLGDRLSQLTTVNASTRTRYQMKMDQAKLDDSKVSAH